MQWHRQPELGVQSTRVFLVEDHAPLRQRVCDAINRIPSAAVIGEAGTVQAGLDGIRASRPDLIIVDYHLGRESGLVIIKAIARELPGVRIIVFSNVMAPPYKVLFKRAGAHWCFDKSTEADEMLRVIAAIADGRDSPL